MGVQAIITYKLFSPKCRRGMRGVQIARHLSFPRMTLRRHLSWPAPRGMRRTLSPPLILSWLRGRLWGSGYRSTGGDLFLTHVDLSNDFWSFLLPEGVRGMFRFRFGGRLWDMERLPFGWKYSPVLCQELLGAW